MHLARGWGTVPASKGTLRKDPNAPDRVAFTGFLKPQRLHDPGLTQPRYVIHPYKVTLSFLGKEWAALDVEVSDPEIEPRAHTRHAVDSNLLKLNEQFAFGELKPVELIDVEHQIAQKIHAVTDPDYARAHDLVDLQLLWDTAGLDLPTVREFCLRTFNFRRAQEWPPPPLRTMDDWELAYDDAREETEVGGMSIVLPGINSARAWFENVISSIDTAAHSRG